LVADKPNEQGVCFPACWFPSATTCLFDVEVMPNSVHAWGALKKSNNTLILPTPMHTTLYYSMRCVVSGDKRIRVTVIGGHRWTILHE
jgi:hypothetical protein